MPVWCSLLTAWVSERSEGVETKEQLDIALAAGCDFIQGFYFSRVLPKREAERYLRELTEQ